MTARDIRYGRQGGRLVDFEGRIDIEHAPRCYVCREPMLLGQPGRHWLCAPPCEGCHRRTGPNGLNCQCPKKRGPK